MKHIMLLDLLMYLFPQIKIKTAMTSFQENPLHLLLKQGGVVKKR